MPLDHIKLQVCQPLKGIAFISALLKLNGLVSDKQVEVIKYFAGVEAQSLE